MARVRKQISHGFRKSGKSGDIRFYVNSIEYTEFKELDDNIRKEIN